MSSLFDLPRACIRAARLAMRPQRMRPGSLSDLPGSR